MTAVLPLVLMLQVSVQIGGSKKPDSAAIRRAQVDQIMEELREDTTTRRSPRRIAVTAHHLATAFKDPAARELLERARAARMKQDSALLSYDAKTYERISMGLGFKAFGRERLAFRHEDASHVTWHRDRGAWVEMTGSRTAVPIAKEGEKEANAEMTPNVTLPYYPGREDLWIGSGLARAEVDERNLVHPIAVGAEAYYTYQTGDSVRMTLPDGRSILLRELRIAAREPKWNVTVGSFWFDVETAHLVRAAYRLSTPMDIWAVANEQQKRDTSRRGRNDAPPFWVKAITTPMRADLAGITVEYGLFNQRFWLPRSQAMEGYAQVSFMRMPVTYEQRFTYESVNALDSVKAMPAPQGNPILKLRDSLRAAGVDSLKRDSILRDARRARAREIADQRVRDCATTGMRTSYQNRAGGAVRVAMQVPCDSTKLANSPDLPASIYDDNPELFGTDQREELMKALSFGLQPGWAPQLPMWDYGLAHTRFNRVEGLSSGVTLTSPLGMGYIASLDARGSLGDRQLNGELTLARGNGRRTVQGTVYRRLEAGNDWGTPLSFGTSFSAAITGRDEGQYYRTWGGELRGMPAGGGTFEWRLFGEQEWAAPVTTRWSLLGGSKHTLENPQAQAAKEYGASFRIRPNWGLDPNGFRLSTDVRAEAAGGDFGYVRGLFDATLSRGLGPLAAAVTLSAGNSAGSVPVQRLFYIGGLHTVRGQDGLAAAGDAYWLTRLEIGTSAVAARPVIFGDLGWAGDRRDWTKSPGRPLSDVGTGMSFLDGLIRFDVARGIYPKQQWRTGMYLEAKF